MIASHFGSPTAVFLSDRFLALATQDLSTEEFERRASAIIDEVAAVLGDLIGYTSADPAKSLMLVLATASAAAAAATARAKADEALMPSIL